MVASLLHIITDSIVPRHHNLTRLPIPHFVAQLRPLFEATFRRR